jgi:hypothetical protein
MNNSELNDYGCQSICGKLGDIYATEYVVYSLDNVEFRSARNSDGKEFKTWKELITVSIQK